MAFPVGHPRAHDSKNERSADSLVRWWKGTRVHRRRILHFSEDVNGVSKNTRKITHKRSGLELAFEQLEMHAQRARHQRLQAEQAAASMAIVRPVDKPSSRPGSPTPSPRVIGTRRRRSRGNSDLEMRSF